MLLLTEQEIDKCIGITDYTTGAMKNVLTQIARSIEAKVIEKIKAQGPAAYVDADFVTTNISKAAQWRSNGYEVHSLYRLPEGD